MNQAFCDILICGAGIVGSSLAVRLAQLGISIVIIDHIRPSLNKSNIIPNSRVSAINHTSVEFFKTINIWKNIPIKFCTSYSNLKVWEWSNSVVTFQSNSIGLKRMGYIIENNRLQSALWKNMINSKLIKLYCPSYLIHFKYDSMYWKCTLSNNVVVNSRLLIGADGIHSQIRKKLGIGVTGWQYDQYCMLLTIKTKYFHNSEKKTVWQIFNPNGPIGFLPLYDNWGSLMWFNTDKYICELKNLPKHMLEKKIRSNFYQQLRNVEIHNICIVPLINQFTHRYIFLQGALIGDAAHVIHPLAGQGINLGIRDVISLSSLLINIDFFNNENINILNEKLILYQRHRKNDILLMQTSINLLYLIFQNNFFPLKIARNIAFMSVEKLIYIKKKILKYAVGI